MIALDLFAGTGWGVACQRLGIREFGVEIMPEAVASREAAGMETVLNDVWDGLRDPSIVPAHDMLIASPPCQRYSMAGDGSGRKNLDIVYSAMGRMAGQARLEGLVDGGEIDPLDALVLVPLQYILDHRPTHIALEQVPQVLPVWQKYADALSAIGYTVDTGVLSAEQYGAPQTRRRAILVAKLGGSPAALPKPTHSKYHSRSPERLDVGVKPWVSMADALGWGMTHRPSPTITSKTGVTRQASGSQDVYRQAILAGEFVFKDVPDAKPSTHAKNGIGSEYAPATINTTVEDNLILQTYPAGFPVQGSVQARATQVGNAVPPLMAQAIIRALMQDNTGQVEGRIAARASTSRLSQLNSTGAVV